MTPSDREDPRDVIEEPAEGCPCSRRAFLQVAIGAGVALSASRLRADEPPPGSTALPKAGDRLVYAEGSRAGQEIKPEDIAYAAINRLMLSTADQSVFEDIRQTSRWRSNNLPLWSDAARSVHAYEGKADDYPEERDFT